MSTADNNNQANTCAISQNKLTSAVISKKTGHLFEKDVIEKHLSSFPYCPITNVPMTIADLVPVEMHCAERAKQEESVSSILDNLKKEYDCLVLERFYLKKHNEITKKELAHSLTANEASHIAIGKLLKEKETTEKELEQMKAELSELTKQEKKNGTTK